MNSKNKLIIMLVSVALVATLTMQFVILPRMQKQKEEYAKNQLNPQKHSLESILEYQSKYMGDASNISQLYNNLPLSNIGTSFKLNPKELSIEVFYKQNTGAISDSLLQQALVYNATASFALIDNLQEIKYVFTGNSYIVTREIVESWYSTEDLKELLTDDKWQNIVQKSLYDNDNYGMKFIDFTQGEQ